MMLILKSVTFILMMPFLLLQSNGVKPQEASVTKLVTLPDELNESSGVIFYNGRVWTHNDSGGTPEISAVNPVTGEETARIRITNGRNIDWEDITQDDEAIYLADTGNNLGNRREFQIYKIMKADIDANGGFQLAKAEIISFSHEKQPELLIPYLHDYDCEAIASVNDTIYLFSKNWGTRNSTIYKLDQATGKTVLLDTIPSNGLITGADYSADTDNMILCGYQFNLRVFKPFIIEIEGFAAGNRKLKHYSLPLVNHQVEGVCYDGNRIFITNEETHSIDNERFNASLFEVRLD